MTSLTDHESRTDSYAPHRATILDGKLVSAEIRRRIQEEIEQLKVRHPVLPGLAVVRVGEDPASVSYAGRIVQSFNSVGLQATVFELPRTATRSMLQSELARLNVLPEFAAIMVQWPL